MSWLHVHLVAEELALWSTLGINAVIIGGGVPAAYAWIRNLPLQRIARVSAFGGGVGAAAFGIAGAVWLALWLTSPAQRSPEFYTLKVDPKTHQIMRERIPDDDIAARCAAMSKDESSVGGCIILGGP